jgi:hypothetical protein
MSLSIRRISGCGAAVVAVAGCETTGAWGVATGWLLPVGFTASSRFHMSRPPPRWAY